MRKIFYILSHGNTSIRTKRDDRLPFHHSTLLVTLCQSVFDEKEILHDFPVSLQQEVMLHSNKHLISIFPVLQSTASGFLMLVTSSMRASLYSKGDVVCLEGELGKCMYFVASGQTYAWVKKSMSLNRRTTEEKSEEKKQGNISRLVSKLSIVMENESTRSETNPESPDAKKINEYTVGFCFCGDNFGEAELLDTKNQFRYLSWTAFSNAEIHTLDKETLRRVQRQFPKEYNKLVLKSIKMQELFTQAIQSVIHCEGKPESCKTVLGNELVAVPRLPKKAFDKVLESFSSTEYVTDTPPSRSRRESRIRNQAGFSPVSFTGGILSSFQNGINRGFSLMGVKKSREDRNHNPFLSAEETEILKTTMYYDSLFEESARMTNSSASLGGYRQNKAKHQLEANLKPGGLLESEDGENILANVEDLGEDGYRRRILGLELPLHPYEKFRLTWDLVLGLIILYNVITIPVRIAFDLQLTLDDDSFQNMVLVVLEVGFDVLFMLDILLNFVTAYYKVDVLITNFRSIAARYASTWLLLDIVASIPFDLILMMAEGGGSSDMFSSVKMLKTLRAARALKLFRARRLLALLSELEDQLGISSSAFTMIKLGVQISLAGHLMGCAFYLVSDKEWLHSAGVMIGSDVKDRYIASLYWAFTTMTTVGYGDIVFHTQYGYLYGVFSMLVGSLIFSFVIGNFSTMAMQMNRAALQFQKKMDKLNEYMHEVRSMLFMCFA